MWIAATTRTISRPPATFRYTGPPFDVRPPYTASPEAELRAPGSSGLASAAFDPIGRPMIEEEPRQRQGRRDDRSSHAVDHP